MLVLTVFVSCNHDAKVKVETGNLKLIFPDTVTKAGLDEKKVDIYLKSDDVPYIPKKATNGISIESHIETDDDTFKNSFNDADHSITLKNIPAATYFRIEVEIDFSTTYEYQEEFTVTAGKTTTVTLVQQVN